MKENPCSNSQCCLKMYFNLTILKLSTELFALRQTDHFANAIVRDNAVTLGQRDDVRVRKVTGEAISLANSSKIKYILMV